MKDGAPLRLKIFFWIILGALSTFFAEVLAGSDLFPFFHLWGLLIVFPLYSLHILVLGHVVFRYGKPVFYVLYPAGLIFGLYEAYITKVLWNPDWNIGALRLGGVAVVEFIVLVFFWHAVMSFVVPIVVGQSVLTKTRTSADSLPDRLKKLLRKRKAFWCFGIAAVFYGMCQSVNSVSVLQSIASGLSTVFVVALLVFIWRRFTSGKDYEMQSLMPGKMAFRILLALLVLLYGFLFFTFRPEALPGISSQATIWAAYAVFFVLLYLGLRKSRKTPTVTVFETGLRFSLKTVLVLALIFTFSSAAMKLLLETGSVFFAWISFLVFGIIGIALFIWALKHVLRKG